jgi:glutathione S-transferase
VQRWGKYVETHIGANLAVLRWAECGDTAALPPATLPASLRAEPRGLWARAEAGFSRDELAAAHEALEAAADRLAATLKRNDCLAGEDFTRVDIPVFPHAAPLAASGVLLAEQVEQWLNRMAGRPTAAGEAANDDDWVTMGPKRGRWDD